MKKCGVLLFHLVLVMPCRSADKIKSVTISVENPANTARLAADVVVSIADLRQVAPDFLPGSMRVLCSSTDASQKGQELPSQVDDLDGDGKADELAFQIDLAPQQTRKVTIQYGEPDQIYRLREDYPERTYALFSQKYEGLGWESENIAFRIYFDARNAIDIYGKRRRSLQLRMYAVPEYPYHDESPVGRDIFKVGDSIGVGAVAAWVDGKVVRAADVKARTWRIISLGPVRTIVELEYDGWDVGGKTIAARSRISMWAGEHGFYHSLAVEPQNSISVVTGFPLKPKVPLTTSAHGEKGSAMWMATWGEQVVAPGATATEELTGQNLGLGIVTTNSLVSFTEDKANYLISFFPQSGEITWYAMAAWDQEGKEQNDSALSGERASPQQSSAKLQDILTTKDAFFSLVRDQAFRMSQPIKVRVVTQSTLN